ncbi:MAG: hypothetical protein JKY56_25180 [Kofleriaceae bacterium]|nr:hypothetical protein [Kofleriaceae bacterium]
MTHGVLVLLVGLITFGCDSGEQTATDDAAPGDADTIDAANTIDAADAAVCTPVMRAPTNAPLPVDLIVAVDNSQSMTHEASDLQAGLNTLASILVASGLDAHLIVISADSSDPQGVCIPAPLGSGSCPADENLPALRHVVRTVDSTNTLQRILEDHPDYAASLRPGAVRSILAVSDNNSSLSSAAFSTMLVAADQSFTDFRFNAVVSPYDLLAQDCSICGVLSGCANCDPCCGADGLPGASCTSLVGSEGTTYKELVAATEGVEGNLCTQDIAPTLEEVANAMVADATPPCRYQIPTTPESLPSPRDQVNVDIIADGGSTLPIPFVAGGEDACGDSEGWYYDDSTAPGALMLCPSSCAALQSDETASPSFRVAAQRRCSVAA